MTEPEAVAHTRRVMAPRRPSLEEQARARGTRPIDSADTYALEGVWESDDEVEEFIEFTYASRRVDGA